MEPSWLLARHLDSPRCQLDLLHLSFACWFHLSLFLTFSVCVPLQPLPPLFQGEGHAELKADRCTVFLSYAKTHVPLAHSCKMLKSDMFQHWACIHHHSLSVHAPGYLLSSGLGLVAAWIQPAWFEMLKPTSFITGWQDSFQPKSESGSLEQCRTTQRVGILSLVHCWGGFHLPVSSTITIGEKHFFSSRSSLKGCSTSFLVW